MPDLVEGDDGALRCGWAMSTPEYVEYHDTEWGFPVEDDIRLFEKLSLEGFQSGLSWLTILRKREGFRKAFLGFDIAAVARMGDADVQRLLQNPSIVRHRGKIEATINNAGRVLEGLGEYPSLASFVWRYEAAHADPSRSVSPESTSMARDLKARGFRFVGPTTVYAFMQAMGLVNDHVEGCAIRRQVAAARRHFQPPI